MKYPLVHKGKAPKFLLTGNEKDTELVQMLQIISYRKPKILKK